MLQPRRLIHFYRGALTTRPTLLSSRHQKARSLSAHEDPHGAHTSELRRIWDEMCAKALIWNCCQKCGEYSSQDLMTVKSYGPPTILGLYKIWYDPEFLVHVVLTEMEGTQHEGLQNDPCAIYMACGLSCCSHRWAKLFRRDQYNTQNYGPLLGPLNTRCRIILRTQKGTIILTTTHIKTRAIAISGRFPSASLCLTDSPQLRPWTVWQWENLSEVDSNAGT